MSTIDSVVDTRPVVTDAAHRAADDARLDPAQLAAVQHDGPALLIVAGAGTGKTRTLVARLARLIDCRRTSGSDPAGDLHPAGGRRTGPAPGPPGGCRGGPPGPGRHLPRHRLSPSAGPRRPAGPRRGIQRDGPGRLRPTSCTGPAAGRGGGRGPPAAIPAEGHPGLASTRGSSTPNSLSERFFAATSRGFRSTSRPSAEVFEAYTARKRAPEACSTSTTSCSTGGRPPADAALRPGPGRRVRPRACRRIPGHQPAPGATSCGFLRRNGASPHRRRRRRPGHLRLPGRDGAQHARTSPASSRGRHHHPGAQLPVHPADPGPRQRRPGRGGGGLRQASLDRRTPAVGGRSWPPVPTRAPRQRRWPTSSWSTTTRACAAGTGRALPQRPTTATCSRWSFAAGASRS